MIAPHLISFLAKHHASTGENFSTLVTELCEALDSGSSCLPLEILVFWPASGMAKRLK